MNDTEVAAPTSGRTGHPHPIRRVGATGLAATLAAMVATAVAAALARAAGVDFEVPEGGETIPVTGVAVVTGVFSLVGTVIAAALLRWSARPATRFLWTALTLTVVSLVPPVLSGANAATTISLVGLHLVAAAVMIPPLTRSLRVIAQRSEHLTGSIDAE
jgi:drug/metabolite transporter (DMT)-like permease